MDTPIIIVIPATSAKYLRMAEAMRASAVRYGWVARFIVVSDVGGDVVVESSPYGGREYKQNFADFIPDGYTGPVVMMDADMLAIGPEPDWHSYTKITVAAMHEGNMHLPDFYKPLCGFLADGLMVVCPTVDSAKALCSEWGKDGNYSNGKQELHSLRMISNHTPFGKLNSRVEPVADSLKHLDAHTHRNIS
jgi:hypothetical protein